VRELLNHENKMVEMKMQVPWYLVL